MLIDTIYFFNYLWIKTFLRNGNIDLSNIFVKVLLSFAVEWLFLKNKTMIYFSSNFGKKY